MNTNPCKVCHAPKKALWPPNVGPNFDLVEVGNWMYLRRCPDCGCLWVTVPYEPHSVFIYKAYWKWGRENWEKIHAIDNGMTLHQWHKAVVCKVGPTLTGQEQESIQRHYTRSYGLEPYVNCPSPNCYAPDKIIENVLTLQGKESGP